MYEVLTDGKEQTPIWAGTTITLAQQGIYGNGNTCEVNVYLLAIVSDTHFGGSDHARPELIAYLPLKANYRTVEEVQHEHSLNQGQRQEDVWGIVPISTFLPNLE